MAKKSKSDAREQVRRDQRLFRRSLWIESDDGLARLGDVQDEWQERDFENARPAWESLVFRRKADVVRKFWRERPRGHSKTQDLAIEALWALYASAHPLQAVAGAAGKEQSRLVRNAMNALLSQNDWLTQFIKAEQYKVRNVHTGSELVILSADESTSYGYTPHFIIVDELTHWPNEKLWTSLITSAGKRSSCVLCVITNAGRKDTWQWDRRETIREADDWHFSRLEGPEASWITDETLRQQRRDIGIEMEYRRLWLNEWTTGQSDALTGEVIDAAVKPGLVRKPQRGWKYVAGLDIGVKRDASGLCVLGKNVGWTEYREVPRKEPTHLRAARDLGLLDPMHVEYESEVHEGDHSLRVCSLTVWTPRKDGKVNLEQVENAVLNAYTNYGCTVLYDPYQCEHIAQRLQRRGVPMVEVPFSKPKNLQEMASEFLERFNEADIEIPEELPEKDGLIEDLRRLKIVEKQGAYRLESPRKRNRRGPGGHGDRATALALAILGCRRYHGTRRLSRPLLHEGLMGGAGASDERPLDDLGSLVGGRSGNPWDW